MLRIEVSLSRVIYVYGRYTGPSSIFLLRIYLDSIKEGRYVEKIYDFINKSEQIF
jgi:hypothetical protein